MNQSFKVGEKDTDLELNIIDVFTGPPIHVHLVDGSKFIRLKIL